VEGSEGDGEGGGCEGGGHREGYLCRSIGIKLRDWEACWRVLQWSHFKHGRYGVAVMVGLIPGINPWRVATITHSK